MSTSGNVIRAVGTNSQLHAFYAAKTNPIVSSTPAPTSFRYRNATKHVNVMGPPLVGIFQSSGNSGDRGPAVAAKIQILTPTAGVRQGYQFWVDKNGYVFLPGTLWRCILVRMSQLSTLSVVLLPHSNSLVCSLLLYVLLS